MNPNLPRLARKYHGYFATPAGWKLLRSLLYGYLFRSGADPVDIEEFLDVTVIELLNSDQFPVLPAVPTQKPDKLGYTYAWRYPNANGFPRDIQYPKTIAEILAKPTHQWALICLIFHTISEHGATYLEGNLPPSNMSAATLSPSLVRSGKILADGSGADAARSQSWASWFARNYGSSTDKQALYSATKKRSTWLSYGRSLLYYDVEDQEWRPSTHSCCMDSPSTLRSVINQEGGNTSYYCSGSAIAASIAAQHEAVAVLAAELPQKEWESIFFTTGMLNKAKTFDPAAHPRSNPSKWAFFPSLRYDDLRKLLFLLSNKVRAQRKATASKFASITAPRAGFAFTTAGGDRLPVVMDSPQYNIKKVSPVVIGVGAALVLGAAYLFWKADRNG